MDRPRGLVLLEKTFREKHKMFVHAAQPQRLLIYSPYLVSGDCIVKKR